MSLFESTDIHAANPPESWEIRRIQYGSSVRWELRIQPGLTYATQSFSTKREAEAARTQGYYFDMWHKESRWYAGESINGWKPYAEIQAEREAAERKRRRRHERAGISAPQMEAWRTGTKGQSAEAETLADLLEWFDSSELFSVASLSDDEAREIHREISDAWGFSGDASNLLHRVKILGIGADRTAIDVLEELAEMEVAR